MREIPSRSLLCLKRNVDGSAGAWALGKEFVGLLKECTLPSMEGRASAVLWACSGRSSWNLCTYGAKSEGSNRASWESASPISRHHQEPKTASPDCDFAVPFAVRTA
jgi:hypothetical protein